jgi:hypothetical protein
MDTARPCPKCQAPLASGESFCSACGFKLQSTPEEQRARFDKLRVISENQQNLRKIRTGRGWILAVSIITLLSGVGLYAIGRSALEEELQKIERQLAGADAEQRAAFDAKVKEMTGMTWEQAVAHDRGRITALLVTNLILCVVYLGLWIWAKGQPFPAALIALLIFITVQVVNLIIDPKMLVQGWLIKVLIIAGLGSAVSAAYRHRTMQEAA